MGVNTVMNLMFCERMEFFDQLSDCNLLKDSAL
jgi:hypothetical protein